MPEKGARSLWNFCGGKLLAVICASIESSFSLCSGYECPLPVRAIVDILNKIMATNAAEKYQLKWHSHVANLNSSVVNLFRY